MAESKKVVEQRSEEYEPERNRRILAYKVTQLVWLLVGILEGLLALRFLLKLIAANPGSPIAAFLYSVTGVFLYPFNGLTATPAAGGIVLEISTLFAMLIYGLLGWAIDRLLWLLIYKPHGPTVEVTETRSHEEEHQHP